jgi:hypothetical protein
MWWVPKRNLSILANLSFTTAKVSHNAKKFGFLTLATCLSNCRQQKSTWGTRDYRKDKLCVKQSAVYIGHTAAAQRRRGTYDWGKNRVKSDSWDLYISIVEFSDLLEYNAVWACSFRPWAPAAGRCKGMLLYHLGILMKYNFSVFNNLLSKKKILLKQKQTFLV